MSDRMHPIPFEVLLDWAFEELSEQGSVFGCKRFYRAPEGAGKPYMGRNIENGIGPAAGPHTQLAQNIAAAYVCGARVFELKTVQKIDGEDLVVHKPCILAEDVGFNCEWSTELTVPQARDEYIKAWFLLHVLAAELELGRQDGFVFNMSVGYDLAGIQGGKIDGFLNDLKDASNTDQFKECREALARRLDGFKRFGAAELEAVSPHICNSVTISTMHGCPPGEIERVVSHLMENKGLNLLLKCNPTLVGYDDARRVLDKLGFDAIRFERDAFDNDLQYADAIPMLRRIQERARELGLYFGVKLTNTLHVKADRGELPDEDIYMSGRALKPLSLLVAARINDDFDEGMPISFCGGADAKNIELLRRSGLFPVTVCTELLKPGGYEKLNAMATAVEGAESKGKVVLKGAADALLQAMGNVVRRDPAPKRAPRPETPAPRAACRKVCGSCASVCPNRANVVLNLGDKKYMLHIDALCNECGNCASFCPDKCAPYLEKPTLFGSVKALEESQNAGFVHLGEGRFLLRWDGVCREVVPEDGDVPEALRDLMKFVRDDPLGRTLARAGAPAET